MTTSPDPLALPPVPRPAPPTHPLRDAMLSAMFVVALAAIGFAALKAPATDALLFENRSVTPWPQLAWSRAFAADFERAFADRFGARHTLLRAHHLALVYGFDVSPATNVLIGRDGWLYFLGEDGTSLERNHRGTLPVADADLAAVVVELKRRQTFLALLGIPYVVTIVPDKFSIYPEHLPAWIGAATARTPLDRLTDAIVADGSLRYVDLRPPLFAAKAHQRVYYATDSHWNLLGAAVGYTEIMREVQRALPPRKLPAIAPTVLPPYVPNVDVHWGDLAALIGVPPRFREPDYAPIAKLRADPSARCAKRTDDGADSSLELYACDRPGLPRAVVYRDSMAIPLIPFLSENFSRVVYVSDRHLDPALIRREKPDVVIEEMVERSMLMLATAALAMQEAR
jgi:alginate O-acetyltransferase complex protein AlgJ